MPIQLFYNVGPLGNNVYVIYDQETKDALLVDPALQSEPVWEFLEEQKLRLTHIVNTHGHMDHVANNAYFKRQAPHAELMYHQEDQALVENAVQSSQRWGMKVEASPAADAFLTGRRGDHGGERSATGDAHTGPHSRRLLIGDKRRGHHRRHPVPELRWPMRPARRVRCRSFSPRSGRACCRCRRRRWSVRATAPPATSVRRKRTTPSCTRRRSGRWGCCRKKAPGTTLGCKRRSRCGLRGQRQWPWQQWRPLYPLRRQPQGRNTGNDMVFPQLIGGH